MKPSFLSQKAVLLMKCDEMFTVVSDARTEGFRPFIVDSESNHFAFHKVSDLLALPDEEFAERYLGEMELYFFEHARDCLKRMEMREDKNLEPIGCSDCRLPIDSARDFRRYYGSSLHHGCFLKRWDADRDDYVKRGDFKLGVAYWDRIAKLNLKS